MTTIAYRNGILAADSRETTSDESAGDYAGKCVKLLRLDPPREPACIVALQGDSGAGMAWLDWFSKGQGDEDLKARIRESEADFTAVVLNKHGLWTWDSWLVPQRVTGKFYAVGSGTKAALGALHMGASAVQAVRVACKIDPWSAPPIVSMSLKQR